MPAATSRRPQSIPPNLSSRSLRIELDNTDGVYYAGELVTGTFALKSNPGELCRSVLLRFSGKARVRWHNGSGKNRCEYSGEKTFLFAERTVWGHYYQTCVVDNPESYVEFSGGADGDGAIYIPCKAGEGGDHGWPMRLVVRVRDCGAGKRDDNYGEVVIDATQLARMNSSSDGDTVTYNLTKKGMADVGTTTLSARFVPYGAAIPANSPSGPPNLGSSRESMPQSSLCLILNVISVNRLQITDRTGTGSMYVQVYRAPDDLMNPPPVGTELPGPNMLVKLPRGETRYRFAFPIRADAPGSVFLGTGDSAYIAYYIQAIIDRNQHRDPSAKRIIVVLPNRPAPGPALLAPYQQNYDSETIFDGSRTCFRCDKAGTATIKLRIGRRAYAPGENIDLTGSMVTNNSKTPLDVTVVISQAIKLISTHDSNETEHKSTQDYGLMQDQCKAFSTFVFSNACVLPALPPSFFGGLGLASTHRLPLLFSYVLTITAAVGGGTEMKAHCPILICTVPPRPEAVKSAMTLKVAPILSVWDVVWYAVTNIAPCEAVVDITGPEDRGTPVPSVSGTGSVFHPVEDAGTILDLSKDFLYEPMVNSFFSPISQTTIVSEQSSSRQMIDSLQLEPQYMEDTAAPFCAESRSDGKEDVAYSRLLSSLSSGPDSRAAVARWIKKYPAAVASLTPRQFASALKRITYSFEQAAVARELALRMPRGKLMCAHVFVCLHECPYSKGCIAMAMAPNVSDPENKSIVLEALSSFEREAVSKSFFEA